jgi:hypothetical protein
MLSSNGFIPYLSERIQKNFADRIWVADTDFVIANANEIPSNRELVNVIPKFSYASFCKMFEFQLRQYIAIIKSNIERI